jgi:glycosyltransferase involved in cell wall biosynthesis
MVHPKILIIGQSFNKNSGGGVTISNLFKGWPKEHIAVASNANLYNNLDTSVCNTFYQLGYNNKLHPFPLGIVLPKIHCGVLPLVNKADAPAGSAQPVKSGKFKSVYSILEKLMHFTGVYNLFYKLKITPEFAEWIKQYNPDIIYTQLASLELIRFCKQLQQQTKKPLAIHMMDDWPLTINKPGIFYNYWEKTIDREFRQLLDNTAVFMSICDAMTAEYRQRYKKEFVPFHNPIDIDFWKPAAAKDYSLKNKFTLLYAGRIGFGIEQSIADVAAAVNMIAPANPNIVFEIQTGDKELLDTLVTFSDTVKWVQPLPYAELPAKFAAADLLLLPQDFDEKSVQFLRYSFPTKVSEYMISGTPILVYGDVKTGLTQYALNGNWSAVVTQNNKQALADAITELYNNEAKRKQLGTNAQQLAMATEDAVLVRERFRSCFIFNK